MRFSCSKDTNSLFCLSFSLCCFFFLLQKVFFSRAWRLFIFSSNKKRLAFVVIVTANIAVLALPKHPLALMHKIKKTNVFFVKLMPNKLSTFYSMKTTFSIIKGKFFLLCCMNVLATYLLITMYNNFVGQFIVDSVSISYIVVNGIRDSISHAVCQVKWNFTLLFLIIHFLNCSLAIFRLLLSEIERFESYIQ